LLAPQEEPQDVGLLSDPQDEPQLVGLLSDPQAVPLFLSSSAHPFIILIHLRFVVCLKNIWNNL
jgi:hypothetical protein